MRVKLDENLPASLLGLLRDRGLSVDTVAEEGLTGCADSAVLSAATSEDRMVITLDRGFGDIRQYPPGTHGGIVVLRLRSDGADAVRDAVESLLNHHDLADLIGAITVVHDDTLRIRRPTE